MDPFRNGAAGVVSSAKLFRPEDFAGQRLRRDSSSCYSSGTIRTPWNGSGELLIPIRKGVEKRDAYGRQVRRS